MLKLYDAIQYMIFFLLLYLTQSSQRPQENEATASADMDSSSHATQPVKKKLPHKKVTVALRKLTCRAKNADAEQKFHAKVSWSPALA